jgi:hypothetical protein
MRTSESSTMNAAVLDFPPIEAPPLAVKPAPVALVAPAPLLAVSIKDAVLAQFKEAENTVLALVEKYRAVAFDVATTKGMNEAKAARLELREKGRFALTRAEKSVKADVNDLKRVMADEVERIVAIVMPIEEAIDQQIKAEEDRKAAAKAERDRIEAERVAAHQAGITKVRAYLARCQAPDMTAERIGKGIDLLTAVAFGPEWEEFAPLAAAAQAETLTAMRALQGQAIDREVAAAKAEDDRIEQQRIAAENAIEAQRLKDAAVAMATQQRAIDAQLAALAAQQKAVADAAREQADAAKADAAARAEAELLASLTERSRINAAEAEAATVRGLLSVITEESSVTEVVAEVAATPAADLFGAAPALTQLAVDPVALLTNCQDALREALLMIQELVTTWPGDQKNARAILTRVADLRALGGI